MLSHRITYRDTQVVGSGASERSGKVVPGCRRADDDIQPILDNAPDWDPIVRRGLSEAGAGPHRGLDDSRLTAAESTALQGTL